MIENYTRMGCDFSTCETDEDYLVAIEAFDEARNQPEEVVDTGESSAMERIAAALEYNNLLNSPVVNEDDPDL